MGETCQGLENLAESVKEKGRMGEFKIKDKSSPCEMRSNFASKIISQGKKIKGKR